MTDWDEIVSEHRRTVFRIAYRILGSVHDAEDVSQDVFTAAFERQQTESTRHWGGFLRQLATMRAIDRLRRNRPTVPLEDTLTGSSDPVGEIVAKELAGRLRAAISELPPQPAAVFALAYFEGLSRNEIAESLGISAEAVSTALYKARQGLSALLCGVGKESKDV